MALEAHIFRFNVSDVTNDEIIRAAYPEANAQTAAHVAVTVDEFRARVNADLSFRRIDWNPDVPAVPNIIEARLREGFWRHLDECFLMGDARIVEVDPHTPYVNFSGFTYILFSADNGICLLLMCNLMD
jgi:hypothetical protein